MSVKFAALFVLTGVNTDTGGLVLTVLFTQIVVRRLFLGWLMCAVFSCGSLTYPAAPGRCPALPWMWLRLMPRPTQRRQVQEGKAFLSQHLAEGGEQGKAGGWLIERGVGSAFWAVNL